MALVALSGAAALALAACGGGSNSSSGGGASSTASFNAAITRVVNPSSHQGGTLSFGLSSTPDSTVPGNTYAWMWNFARLYTMPLMTYESCPGQCGLQVVPDLTGSSYQLHPVSTGPYKFQSYQLNKQLTLVPNTFWNPSTDPNAKQLPSKITATFNMNANDIDNRLLAGDVDVDAAGTGVQAAARAKILASPTLKATSDDPISGFLWFAYLNTKVPPLNNISCRIAVEYAANKVDQQTAYGGPYAGGAIASTVAPPNVIGQKHFDLYEATSKPTGDLAKARAALKACGQPNGFSTGIAYRSDRPKEVQAAQSLQAALGRVGIKLSLHGYPTGTYFADFAGVPKYTEHRDLGIAMGGWEADWPDGYGFFNFITAGYTISPSGNYNVAQLNDPVVNNLLQKMAVTDDATKRNSYTVRIDMQVMKDAAILPEVYAKSLLYRNSQLTNVFVQPYYGMYNYSTLGLK
jgi:peptide/nickel transport system substrate-binding protein